ncbi:B-cell receptor CD22-like [Anomaloglossus baeobatrachus]|uniref:B-cell receptor CD22-like n=1 Tax=Anomaloglossus baeobatrachus TaxID=238106 RepID=UPI003F4F4F88
MDPMKQIYLLLIYKGFYLGSVCQRWTLPYDITALLGSCVEIPCTYHPAGTSGASSTVWYLYNTRDYPEILNTKDSSTVMEEYKDRTSQVAGNNSCTLRIDPVRRRDDRVYYPGITEDKTINAYDKHSGYVLLSVTDSVNVQLSGYELLTLGVSATIRCTVKHTCRSSPPSLQWNKPGQTKSQSVELSEGTWREESELTYIPSHADNGTNIQCTAIYPNELKAESAGILNINYAATGVHITVKNEGEFTKLICDFLSSRPDVTHYTWMKDGSILQNQTGKILTMGNNVETSGKYSCIAHNSVGDSSSEDVDHTGQGSRHIILIITLTTIGTIFLLLILWFVFARWRDTLELNIAHLFCIKINLGKIKFSGIIRGYMSVKM